MPFEFNIYSSLLLPAFIQGILFSFLLFSRGYREERLSDTLLGWLLLLNAVKIAYWMLGFAGWYDTHDGFTSFMFYFPFNNVTWMGPLLYFYFLSLVNPGFRFEKKHWPHFILPGLWLLFFITRFTIDFLIYTPFPVEENTQFGTKGPLADLEKNTWGDGVSLLSFFFYLLLTLRAFRIYQSYIRQQFSFAEAIRLDWLRNILYLIITGVLIFFLFSLLAEFGDFHLYKFNWFAYLALGIVIYYLSISGYFLYPRSMEKLQFEPAVVKEKEPATNLSGPSAGKDVSVWTEKLLTFMESGKPYLEPELTLGDLAKRLQTNTSVLSKVINDGTGRNFNDFINRYRVEEVARRLQAGEHRQQTLLGIAYDSGFNSKATFNRSFKKLKGMTPKAYADGLVFT